MSDLMKIIGAGAALVAVYHAGQAVFAEERQIERQGLHIGNAVAFGILGYALIVKTEEAQSAVRGLLA